MDKKIYFVIFTLLLVVNSILVLGAGVKADLEICHDGMDNDGDELVDCADPNCYGKLGNLTSNSLCEEKEKTCNDGFDNDRDGLIDCADPDCSFDCYCDDYETLEDPQGMYSPGDGSSLEDKLFNSRNTLNNDLSADSDDDSANDSYLDSANDYYLDSVYDNPDTGLVIITYRYSGDPDDVDNPGIVHYVDENGDIVKVEELDSDDFDDYVSEDDVPLSPWFVTLIVAVLIIIAVLIFVRRHRRG